MMKSLCVLALGLLAGATVLLSAGPCAAQYRAFRPMRPVTPYFPPNRMPGWDNWRINPYSPYNYGRNPYNPIRVPYVAPYPVYTPYVMPYSVPYTVPYTVPSTAALQTSPPSSLSFYPGDQIPIPTGPMRSPPPGTAEIVVRVPDQFAQVWFDGENTSTMGATRYYVTPNLPPGQDCHYDLKVQWNQGGRTQTEERRIRVRAGQTTVIDLTQS
jgi:uncharacterized protein (TIGR03000 family)